MNEIIERSSSHEVQFRAIGGANLLILVPVSINGAGSYDFILDSGATHSMVSTELAQRLGMEPDSDEQGIGAGGAVQMPSTRVRSIHVGSACQENSRIYISNDLEQIGAAAKSNVDGAIGFDFLRDFRLKIDYRRNKVCFARSAERSQEALGAAASIPFTITPAEALILLPITVNGHGPFQFIIDTAAGRTAVAPELLDQCKISPNKEVAVVGAGGKLTTRRVNLESLTMGGVTIPNLTAMVGQFLDSIGSEVGQKVHGVIGSDVLSRFLVTIDCREHRLMLDSV